MPAIDSIKRLDPKNIVIFRALQLGDMLNLVPALRALRAAYPAARISLVGLPWAVQFVERFHTYIDEFVNFPVRLMEFLGIPLKGDALEFPILPEDNQAFDNLRASVGLQEIYVCIHPGARKLERRWPPSKFAAVADGLARQGYQIVLTGSGEEAELTAAVTEEMKAPAIQLAAKTTLGSLAVLLSNCRLLVSNDTGVSHLTAAIKAPSLILFSAPDHDRWAPRDLQLHKTIQHSMSWTADEVLLQAERYLKEVHSHV